MKSNSDLEATWFELEISSQKILISSIYRLPDDMQFFEKLQKGLEPLCQRRSNLLVLGDLNADLHFERGIQKDMRTGKMLLRLLKSLNLHNMIQQPTRITETTETLIDLIITSNKSKVIKAGTFNTGTSDHHLVYAGLHLRIKNQRPTLKEVRDYKNINIEAVKRDFGQAPWNACTALESLEDSTWAWEQLFKSVLNKHVKIRKAKVKSNSLLWMNSAVRKEMNIRYKLLKRAQKSLSPENWKRYKRQRNYVTSLCKKTEAQYWKTKFENSENATTFWRTVKEMQGKRGKTSIGPLKDEYGNLLKEDQEMANSLNHYFSTVGQKLARVINEDIQESSLRMVPSTAPIITNIQISEEKVHETIKKKVKNGKSCGHDEINSKDIRMFGKFAAPGLAIIMKNCIERKSSQNNGK